MAKIKRILLAEDNENDVELTLTALQEYRLRNEVEVVRDGAEALDYIYQRGKYSKRVEGLPCVILLDLKMPRVDGIEVLRQIKSDPALRHIPVVMLTSSREEKDLVASYDLGVNAFVVKPVDFDQFLQAIRSLGMFWAIVNEAPPVKPTA
ncbi:MAG TPA: response regulator [Candidatus Methylacidiphilales bacterium]|jgi:CheY-like chemotaxis protein|nr:response regulator [Candidatus Methylacidiphilales bacterium]